MPVERVIEDGQPGFRWGASGKVYRFLAGNAESRNRAYARAARQGRAIQAKPTSYVPPASVAVAARRGLALRGDQPPSNRAGTPVGIRRASQLANRQPVSIDTLKRMKAYFDRHEVDKKGEGWGKDSKGYQAWLLWGGDTARAWVHQVLTAL